MATRLLTVRAKEWVLYLWGARGSLSTNVIREICSYIADLQLPQQVTATFLRFYNCEASTWGPRVPLHAQIQADRGSSWVVLKDRRLFCSGGGNCQAGCHEYQLLRQLEGSVYHQS